MDWDGLDPPAAFGIAQADPPAGIRRTNSMIRDGCEFLAAKHRGSHKYR
jgi:hypothetical protein